jgi:Bacterial SH3 domain
MSSSPAPRPVLRSYYLPAPTVGPRQAVGKVLLALLPVAASAVWALSTLRGPTATAPVSPAVEQPVLSGADQADPRLAEPGPAEVAASDTAAVDAAPPPAVASAAPAAPQSIEIPAALLEASSVESVAAPPAMPTPRVRLVIDGSQMVNLRAEASSSGTVLAMLLPGVILEEIAPDAAGAIPGWRRVRWNGREGWIAASLVVVKPAPLSQVPVVDQGIDFQHPVQPGVYPLREISTGQQITDRGRPVYVDDSGSLIDPDLVRR